MKATQIVLLFNLSLGLLASLPPGRALAWDTTNAMKNPPVNADQKAKDFCLGNKCGGYLESATVDVDNQNLVLHGRFNLHNVQEQCIRRPFGGKWCWDIYNYYVHIDFTGTVNNCHVTSVFVQTSDNPIYSIPATFADLIVNSPLGLIAISGIPGCP